MALEFRTALKFLGDSKGAVKATRATRKEVDKLSKSQQHQNSIAKRATKSAIAGARAVAGIAAAAGAAVAVIGRFAKGIADQGDRIQKLSIQLGTSTEFLSGMAHAAELSGSSMEGFATSMKKMEKSIGDLDAGLSTQIRSFQRLGLTYDDIKRLSPEDQFLKIAGALGDMENPTLRMATAMDIFGRAGGDMIPLFAAGEEGIAAMRAEAERLGLVMSSEFADASAQFNDDLTRSAGLMTGLKRSIGEGLLPELTALMQHFLDGAEAGDSWTKVGQVMGNTVRVLVAGFTILKEVVVLVAKTIWTAAGVIVDALQAITAPFTEFVSSAAAALAALSRGDFAAAASAFTGLGDRIKASFLKNVEQIEAGLATFGTSAKEQIAGAVADVNDILTRMAVVSQDAAHGVTGLGEEIVITGSAADRAAKQLQTLTDRLDPLARMQRNFTVEQAILASKIAEGGDQVIYYSQLLEQLKEDYAGAARSAVGFGDQVKETSEKAVDDTADMAVGMTAEMTSIEEAFRQGVRRMDDLFKDLWASIFEGGGNMFDKLKSFFTNWLAEMAHAAITRPIVVQMTAAMGGGVGGIGSAVAGQATNQAGGSMLSMFSGGGGVGSGIMSAAAAVPVVGWIALAVLANWGFAKSGWTIGGGGLDTKGQLMSGFGAGITLLDKFYRNLGLSDKWASILSGGGVLTRLFGHKKPELESSGVRGTFSSGGVIGENFFNIKRKGGLFRGTKRYTETSGFDDELQNFFDGVISSVGEFGQKLATEAGVNIDEALANFAGSFDITLDEDPDIAQQQIKDLAEGMGMELISAMAESFGPGVQEFVSEVDGIDAQLGRLSVAAKTIGFVNEEIRLTGRTFKDFAVVAESMRYAGEDLTTALGRLLVEVSQVIALLDVVDAFASSDLAADFDAIIAGQQTTLLEFVTGIGDQIRDLSENFTGSADDLALLATLSAQHYEAELAYMLQLKQAGDQLVAGFQPLKDQIFRDLHGDKAVYERNDARIEQLALELQTETDPARIAAMIAEVQRLSAQNYGLLDDEGKASTGQAILDFITRFETDAQARIDLARDTFLGEGGTVREIVGEMAEGFGDPLTIAATAHEGAAEALESSADAITTAVTAIPNAIADGFSRASFRPVLNLTVNVDSAGNVTAGIVNA